jgi:type IV secretory pathway VirB10-like protein
VDARQEVLRLSEELGFAYNDVARARTNVETIITTLKEELRKLTDAATTVADVILVTSSLGLAVTSGPVAASAARVFPDPDEEDVELLPAFAPPPPPPPPPPLPPPAAPPPPAAAAAASARRPPPAVYFALPADQWTPTDAATAATAVAAELYAGIRRLTVVLESLKRAESGVTALRATAGWHGIARSNRQGQTYLSRYVASLCSGKMRPEQWAALLTTSLKQIREAAAATGAAAVDGGDDEGGAVDADDLLVSGDEMDEHAASDVDAGGYSEEDDRSDSEEHKGNEEARGDEEGAGSA